MTSFSLALDTVKATLDYMGAWGMKTYDYYRRVFVASVNALYNDKITVNEFVDKLSTLIYNQLFSAWREGMADVGLDPKEDFTQEMADIVSKIADEEVGHIRDFSGAIVSARQNETLAGVQARAEMWANRYLDVQNQARIYSKPEQKFVWRLGATEEHCEDCAGYDGKIMTGAEWAKEKQPQS